MTCKRCPSTRIASVSSKASDMHFVCIGNAEHDGYLPHDMGIGGGDYLEFQYCLDCGHIQGNWPLLPTKLESDKTDD